MGSSVWINVFAFVSLLADKVDRMLKEAEDAVLVAPTVITMAVIAGEGSGGGGADLLGRFEPPFGDSLRQLFEAGAQC